MRREFLILTLFGAACERGPAPEELLVTASRRVTLGTLASIGPHRGVTTITRRYVDAPTSASETMELRWGDWDNLQLTRARDGKLRSELRIIEGVAWLAQGAGRFSRRSDAEMFRVELRTTWSGWEQALAPFAGRVILEAPRDAVVEGRPATTYDLRMGSAEGAAKKGTEPIELSGTVTLDQATAIRLLAQVEGRYRELGRVSRERVVELEITRGEFGSPPALETPQERRRRR